MYQKIIMSATNINMTVPKPSMYYDCTYPFAGLKKPTDVDAELIREKQYNYSKAFISRGDKIEEIVELPDTDTVKQYNYSKAFISRGDKIEEIVELPDTDTVKHLKYSGAVISHGETIEEVPEYVPKKKYMWTTVVDFFKQRQKFGRHPFVITPNI
jgi:hypothetical protein